MSVMTISIKDLAEKLNVNPNIPFRFRHNNKTAIGILSLKNGFRMRDDNSSGSWHEDRQVLSKLVTGEIRPL